MASFFSQLDTINEAVRDSFGSDTVTYQPYSNGFPVGAPLTLKAVPLDPIRLEGNSSGQFTARWFNGADFAAVAITPKRGDRIEIPNTAHTVGGVYTVHQVQADTGNGVRLILNLLNNRITGASVTL